jgi:hypothetical protein
MERALQIALSFALLGSASSSVVGDCKCVRPQEGETTHWGGNMSIELEQKSTLKIVQGRVENVGKPLRGALVEVFESDGHILRGSGGERQEQKRLAACRTSGDGKFCFKNLPSGTYEVRSSIDSGWDVTHVVVTVDAKKGKNDKLRLSMNVGT